jgi:hypothetical protein
MFIYQAEVAFIPIKSDAPNVLSAFLSFAYYSGGGGVVEFGFSLDVGFSGFPLLN